MKPESDFPIKDLQSEFGLTVNSPVLIDPLIVDKPNKKQVIELLEVWLAGKASILSGNKAQGLSIVAREALVRRVEQQRDKDSSLGESQVINATINSVKVVSQTKKRIEVKVLLSYSDKRNWTMVN